MGNIGDKFCQGCNEVIDGGKTFLENNLTRANNPPITNIKNPFFFGNKNSSSFIEHQTNNESYFNNINKSENTLLTTLNNHLPIEEEQKIIKDNNINNINTENNSFNINNNDIFNNNNEDTYKNNNYNNYNNINNDVNNNINNDFNNNINNDFSKNLNDYYKNNVNNIISQKINNEDKNNIINDYSNNINNNLNNNINNDFINKINNNLSKNLNNYYNKKGNNNSDNNNFDNNNSDNSSNNSNDFNENTVRNSIINNNDNNLNTINNNIITISQDIHNKETIEDISAKKITNLFRKFKEEKNKAHSKLYKDILKIPSSDYIIGLNHNQLDVNLAPEETYIYLGTKFNDKKDGLGLEIFNNSKAKYFGIFKDGKRKDFGVFTINNNSKNYLYYGYILGLYAYGFGCYKDKKDSKEYEGMWFNSMKNGLGIEKYSDKSVYKGNFLNGKKAGIGYYQWSDKSSYEGEWKENKIWGFGIYKFNDGSEYKGEWKRSRFHGFGEFTHPGIKKYIGFFQKDKRFGFGIEIWFKVHKTFIGYWKNDNLEGFGKFIVNDKKQYGIWKKGKLVEKFKKKNEFYKRLKKEKIPFLDIFQLDDYSAVLYLIEGGE